MGDGSGNIIGWKKGILSETGQRTLIKLEIDGAVVKSRNNTKMRASAARVLSIELLKEVRIGYSHRYEKTGVMLPVSSQSKGNIPHYVVGCRVIPSGFNEDTYETCGEGIHFFTSEQEAIDFSI